MIDPTKDLMHQNESHAKTAIGSAYTNDSEGPGIAAPNYNLASNNSCPPTIASSGNNADTQQGMYGGNQMTSSSGFCINNPVFNPATMKNTLPGAHFQGAGEKELADAMIVLYNRPTGPKLDAAIAIIAQIRGINPQEAKKQYEYAMQIKDKGQDFAYQQAEKKGEDPHEVSPNFASEDIAEGGIHHGFTGSTGQLRFGMVIGDVFGIDPVFGSLISPTGGAVGPGDSSISNVDPDSPTVLHGVVHDAAGYLLNAHGAGPGYNYLGSGIEPLSTENPLTGQLSGMMYWNDTMYADGDIHRNQNGTAIGADGRFGAGHFNLGKSNLDIGTGEGFIGATPDSDGGTKYGLGGAAGVVKGNIDLAQTGQWIFGEDTVPDTVIANLEYGGGTAAVDAWVNPDSGFSLGAQANVAEAALTAGTSDKNSSADEVGRFGLSKGVGLAGRGHWGDSDADGFREYGFGADFGPFSFDAKSEDPLRTLMKSPIGFGPLSDLWLPQGNITHDSSKLVGGLASDAWETGSGAVSRGMEYAQQVGSQLYSSATEKADELWGKAKDFGRGIMDGVSSTANSAIKNAKKMSSEILSRGKNIAGGLWDAAQSKAGSLLSKAKNFGSSIFSKVKGLASSAYEKANAVGSKVLSKAKGLAANAYSTVKKKFYTVKQKALKTVSGLYNAAKKKAAKIKQFVKTGMSKAYRMIKGLAGDAYDMIPEKVKSIVDSTIGWMRSGVSKIQGLAYEGMNQVKSFAKSLTQKASHFVMDTYSKVKGLASDAFQSLKSSASTVIDGIKNAAESVFSSVSGLASDAWDAASGFGSSILDGAKDVGSGIIGGAKSIGKRISSIFG